MKKILLGLGAATAAIAPIAAVVACADDSKKAKETTSKTGAKGKETTSKTGVKGKTITSKISSSELTQIWEAAKKLITIEKNILKKLEDNFSSATDAKKTEMVNETIKVYKEIFDGMKLFEKNGFLPSKDILKDPKKLEDFTRGLLGAKAASIQKERSNLELKNPNDHVNWNDKAEKKYEKLNNAMKTILRDKYPLIYQVAMGMESVDKFFSHKASAKWNVLFQKFYSDIEKHL